jgi:hypothetical protein
MHSQKVYVFPYFIIFSVKNQPKSQKNRKKKKNNRLKVELRYAIMSLQTKALHEKMLENTQVSAPRGICYYITNEIFFFLKNEKIWADRIKQGKNNCILNKRRQKNEKNKGNINGSCNGVWRFGRAWNGSGDG